MRGGDADRVKSMQHEMPVHHVTGSALVANKIKLLKSGEQEVCDGLLEYIVQFCPNELYAAGIDSTKILATLFGTRWHVATVCAKPHAGRELLLSLTSKVPGLQGLIARY
jgi:hypothetical protein